MNPKTEQLQEALHRELRQLQSAAELALTSASHLNGLALNPDAARQDLVPESTVIKEIAALLQHAVQNVAHNVGSGKSTLSPLRQSRGRTPRTL